MKLQPRPLPVKSRDWLAEIAVAYQDALETIPFGLLERGEPYEEGELFHLAPYIALKLRGFDRRDSRRMKKARDAALASHVASTGEHPDLEDDPLILFAFCYLASHYGLELVTELQVARLMKYLERHRAKLARSVEADLA